MQREYGRCVGKIYIDDNKQLGWVFESRQQYENSTEFYIREVWITVHSEPPTIVTKYHYFNFGG